MLKEKFEVLKSENVMIAILVIIILAITSFYLLRRNSDKIIIEKKSLSQEINQEINQEITQSKTTVPKENDIKKEEQIKIYIVGEVKNPGVYTIKRGQIIEDVINLAGGFTSQADVSNINLVYKLNENSMIKILQKNTQSKQKAFEIIQDNRGVVETANKETTNKESSGGKKEININTATKESLNSLPGVGDSTAEKIIKYRNDNGPFKNITDLKKVSGIGEAKYNGMKELIVVD